MISKELLSEVLSNNVKGLKSFGMSADESNLILQFNDMDDVINIYELAHKCKEWAYNNGYSIVSGIDTIGNNICYAMKITGYSQDYYYEQSESYDDVFKACEYILEQNK